MAKSKFDSILQFLEQYSGNQYKMLKKCKTDEELRYMESGSEIGKKARADFTEIIDIVSKKFCLEKGKITQWQNSGTFVSYFWCQLKREKYKDSNISLAIFAEKTDDDVRFRASVELAVESATEQEQENYRRLLDKELEPGLVYISGGNNEKEFRILSETNHEAVKKLNLKKVQVSYIVDDNRLENDQIFLSSLFSGAEHLLEYYDYIMGNNTSTWWPSLFEYTPNISKDQWLSLLNDGKTFTDNAFYAIAALYDFGGSATCRQLEESYGRTSDFYRSALGTQLASKVKRELNLPYYVDSDGNNKVWPILFQGRNATQSENGNFVWKIRPELYAALEELGIEKYLNSEEEEKTLTRKEVIEQIRDYITAKGFSYPSGMIENFYLSLKSKPFVILAGTSGTGKTRLVRLFAEAIGATAENGRYKLVSVRPDWSDSSDLFGHVNLKGEFVPGAIIDFVKEASMHLDKPYFLCLDEMNLARVEYYLSDFLSVIETRHKTEDGIVTDEVILDVSAKEKYGKVMIPENLYVIGTVNMDETTFPFSKKVLDRANTIEFSYVDLEPDFEDSMDETNPLSLKNDFLKTEYLILKADIPAEEHDYAKQVSGELQSINQILLGANAHVGYRVRDEIVFYMLNNKSAELLDYNEAMDNEIMQKILPRIQGSSSSVKELLCELFKKCAGDYTGLSQSSVSEQMKYYIDTKDCLYKKSAEKISYMMRRYEEDGFTSYWL